MPTAIHISPRVLIPESALSFRAVRAAGPGGQNVNKVASRVELRVDLERIEGLSAGARRRLDAITARRRDSQGRLLVTSQRTRDQHRNLEDAREKVRHLVAQALTAPRVRRATRPTLASRERRLIDKRLRSARKRERGKVRSDE